MITIKKHSGVCSKILFLFLLLPISFAYAQNNGEIEFGIDEDEEAPFEYEAFFRHGMHYTASSSQDLLSSFSALRLGFFYEAGNLKIEGSLHTDFNFSNQNQTITFPLLWSRLPRNRLFPLEAKHRDDTFSSRLQAHRLYLAYSLPSLNIKIGRQAISWGQGRFLNPLDLITPIDVFILDIDDISGVDALDVSYFLNDTDFIEWVLIPYREKNEDGTIQWRYQNINSLLRLKATYLETDVILLGGYHFRSWVWGAEAVKSAFSTLWRMAYLGRYEIDEEGEVEINNTTYVREKADRHQIVVGTDKTLWGKLRSTLEVLINFSNKNDAETLQKLSAYEPLVSLEMAPPLQKDVSFFQTQGRVLIRNLILAQISFSYELTDSLLGGLFVLYDIEGSAAFFLPQLEVTLNDSCVWSTSAQLFAHSGKTSDFDGSGQSVYSFMKFYF